MRSRVPVSRTIPVMGDLKGDSPANYEVAQRVSADGIAAPTMLIQQAAGDSVDPLSLDQFRSQWIEDLGDEFGPGNLLLVRGIQMNDMFLGQRAKPNIVSSQPHRISVCPIGHYQNRTLPDFRSDYGLGK